MMNEGKCCKSGMVGHTQVHAWPSTLVFEHTHTGRECGLVGPFINELCCVGRAAVVTMQEQDEGRNQADPV